MSNCKSKFIAIVSALSICSAMLIQSLGASLPTADGSDESVEVIVTFDEHLDSAAVGEVILDCFPDAKLLASYDTLLCGMALRLDAASASLLTGLDFIESVRVCGEFEALTADEAELSDRDSLAQAMPENSAALQIGIGSDASLDGLDGDGIVVAVIDSGFDVTHGAFYGDGITESIDKTDVEKLFASRELAAAKTPVDVSEVYISPKIPFAFDYAHYDADVSTSSNHGTHVAGIIGARETYEGSMRGIAPGAQLILMKIFGDDGVAVSDYMVITALEDAIKLGADVINLSLGRYAGSAQADHISGMNKLLSRAKQLGCVVVGAAGNESVATDRSQLAKDGITSLPIAQYTDYGTVAYPASSESCFAVASVNGYYDYSRYFTHGDSRIFFADTNASSGVLEVELSEHFDGKTLSYVPIPGIGAREDYAGLNVRGKLALVKRGEITFVEKASFAAQAGALGVIVYDNNPDEIINMDLKGAPIPAISISLADGEVLIASDSREICFSKEYWYFRDDSESMRLPGQISHFSSLGATPSLSLKPDICAVGRSVYSTIATGDFGLDRYGGMSGSSMASPQLAGVCALLLEKLERELTPEDDLMRYLGTRVDKVRNMLMNTASLVVQENGVEYSPRAQGSGLVNPALALSRELELTYSANGRAKAELYDLLGEQFYLEVMLENLTDRPLELSLGVTLTGDGWTELEAGGEVRYFSTLEAVADGVSVISADEVSSLNRYSDGYAPLVLVLEPSERRAVELEFKLDRKYSEQLDQIFTNGRFVEGFVICETENGEYSLPYMGYHGDWGSAPILDADIYSDELSMFGGSALMVLLNGNVAYAGDDTVRTLAQINESGEPVPEIDMGRFVFSPNGDNFADTLYLNAVLLRNTASSLLRVLDSDGEEVYRLEVGGYYNKSEGVDSLKRLTLSWDGHDGNNIRYTLPDGDYRLEYTFTLDYVSGLSQTLAYDIRLDTEKPELVNTSIEDGVLTITASDENPMLYIRLYDGDAGEFNLVSRCDVDEDGNYYAELPLDGAPERLYIELLDQGFNSTVEIFEIGGGV